LFDVLDGPLRRRSGGEDLADADSLSLGCPLGDGPADEDVDVFGLVLLERSTILGTRVMWAPERIETPMASASSWMAVSTTCSGVWWRPV
jgi:hypothetical protein